MIGKNKDNIVDEATVNRVNQDLIVHNMPNQIFSARSSSSSSISHSVSDSKNNFKMIGAVIVGFGVLLVGVLIYLSYYFIIKPKTKPVISTPVQTQSIVENTQLVEKSTSTENVATTSATFVESSQNTSIDVDLLASSTATSTESVEEEILVDLPPLLDTDSDGLLDDEESIFGSNYLLVDTDSDGYHDLAEIQNGYSPLQAGKKLYPNESLIEYEDDLSKFTLFYPKDWEIRSLNNGYTVMMSLPDNSLIQVSVSENTNIQNILTWYESTFSGEIANSENVITTDTWEGIAGDDKLNYYLTDKERENIYIISYIPSISGRVAYPHVFEKIVDSFQLTK